jgi:hypothetical protein
MATLKLNERSLVEPPRDLRRLFVVSQAAIAWLCC